jgi:hypothetical protein
MTLQFLNGGRIIAQALITNQVLDISGDVFNNPQLMEQTVVIQRIPVTLGLKKLKIRKGCGNN